MANYKRKKIKESKKAHGEPKNGSWSRMVHKWWLLDRADKKGLRPDRHKKKKWKCKKGRSNQHDWRFHGFKHHPYWPSLYWYDCIEYRCNACGKHDEDYNLPIGMWVIVVIQCLLHEKY